MKKIFISYRRAEAEYAAGALGRELRAHFGEEQVFRDKEDIAGGVSWKLTVLQEIDRDSALLVLMGKEWAQAKDAQGARRLDNPQDPIFLELNDALSDGATVIPVLLENAAMPLESDLPPALKPMAEMNALRLRDSDWGYDLSKIVKTLEKSGFAPLAKPQPPPAPGPAPAPAPASDRRSGGYWGTFWAALILVVLLFAAFDKNWDSESFVGGAVFAALAFGLAAFSFTGLRHVSARAKWSSLALMGLAALVTLGYIGWAVDPGEGQAGATGGQDPGQSPVVVATAPAATPSAPADAPANPPVNVAARPAPASAGVTGRWRDSEDGTIVQFTEEGGNVHMIATNNGMAVEGYGQLSGSQLRVAVRMAGTPMGELQLTLSGDGRRLAGHHVTQDGRDPVTFVR